MNEPELISKSYENDRKIMEWCNGRDDIRCRCVYPPDDIKIKNINQLTPFYCWYPPCDNGFVTTLIQEEKKFCNNIDCQTNLGNVTLNNTDMNITNTCQRLKLDSYFKTDTFFDLEYSLPNFYISFIFPFLLLFLIMIL